MATETLAREITIWIFDKIFNIKRSEFRVHANILSAEGELEELRNAIDHIEAQRDHKIDDRIKKWSSDAKKLESEAANLTETHMKQFEQWQEIEGFAVDKRVRYRFVNKELKKIRLKMFMIMQEGEEIGVDYRQQEADTPGRRSTTYRSSIYACATSAMTNLEVANGRLLYSGLQLKQKHLYRDIKSTRSQLLPLFEILNQVANLNVCRDYEMHRVWTHMVEDIFESVDKESISFQKSPLGKKDTEWQKVLDFFTFITQKKKEIFILWSRFHTYNVALVIPHMEPATLRSKLFLQAEAKWKVNSPSLFKSLVMVNKRVEEYKKSLEPIIEVFKKDQMLMNALWKDAKGVEVVDARGKVWVKNMKELQRELEAVCKKHSLYVNNPTTKVKQYRQLLKSAQLLQEFIYFLTMRKRYYCIDIFVQRDGSSSKHGEEEKAVPLPSILFKKDLVKLLQIEMQLMEALFQDVETINKPDDRLKVWIQEMCCVVNHYKPIIQQILDGSFTSRVAANKIKSIGKRIQHISEWSLTYGIGSIRSGKGPCQEFKKVRGYRTGYVADHVELIKSEARMMKALESDIQNMHGINSGTLEAWLEEMREVGREAQFLVSSYFNNGNNAKSRREVLRNVRLIKSKIKGLHQRRRDYGIKHFDRKLSYTAEGLRARLLADKSEPFRIIQVLGAWDNDKEFVKKFIEEDDPIVSHYASPIWLSAKEANDETILKTIERITEHKNSNDSVMVSQADDIVEDLCTQNRRLIVLDEIRSSFNLNSVRKLLSSSKGSRVILITSQRNEDLYGWNPSELMFSITIRELPPDREISMLQMAPKKSDSNPSLTTPNPSIKTIASYLMTCLYYFLLFFPTDKYIPVRRLISLWVAEGFVRQKSSEADVPLELIAMRYLSELMQLGLVEAKEKGVKLKRCRLKDDRREECLTKANEEQFLQATNYSGVGISNIFRLADHPGYGNDNPCHFHIHDPDNHPISLTSHYRDVISFLSFDTQERSKPGEDIGIFLDKGISKKCFLSLRILDLEHIFRPALPKELAKLIQLRYLGLRWTYLEALPQSVSELLNLQVLDVKHTYISKLPESIWRMQYLRHLYISETYRTRFNDKPYGSTSLKDLQTLWGAFVDEDSPVEGGLDMLLNVRKLGLLCRSMYDTKKMVRQLEAVAIWVVSLKDLESLRLKSQDQKGMPSDLYLRPLSTHGNLAVLHISGILKYPSVICDLPLNLTEVTLSGCKLENDPLHSMEFLPRLIILRLLGDASKCLKMRCSSTGFPKLEVLKLWKLETLVEVEVEERGMPLLRDFDVRDCPELERLAHRLKHLCRRTKNQDSTSKGIEEN